MLTQDQIDFYVENGFLAVEDVIPQTDIERARAVTEEFVEQARAVATHDSVFDLEPGHTAAAPRVRRLKEAYSLHPIFQQIGGSERVLGMVADLIGPGVRYQGSKLNMKAAAYGSPVEWHQDFAFYPHTNDDLLAVGVALDDSTPENGCLLMLPGSHRQPIFNHHQDGVFVGAVDVEREGIDVTQAVSVPVRAGGITLHHTRMFHASAPNLSGRPRRLFLIQFAAVDAWPVLGVADLEQFDARILRGTPTKQVRIKEMDIRIPLPTPEQAGSIYELQTAFRPKTFVPAR